MRSLQIALSGLLAHQRGIDVTGHNIANASTAGYARQVVQLVSVNGPLTPALHARWPGGGQGVDVVGVERVHDAFLAARGNLEHGASGRLRITDATLGRIEQLFPEPGDQGLQHLLSGLWSAWSAVGSSPDSTAARAQLLEQATSVADAFNNIAEGLNTIRSSSVDQLDAVVDEVNTLAANIATLNRAVRTAQSAQLDHADLLDQRDMLVRRLSDLVDLRVLAHADGTIDVAAGGGTLVRGDATELLQADTGGPTATLRWVNTGFAATVTGGEAGGLLESLNDVLPRYSSDLDTIALTLRDAVNGIHGAISGSIAVGSQDLSAIPTLSIGVGLNGSYADATIAGADFSGATGAADLQTALQAAVDAATGSPGAVVATVTGGNGTPLVVRLDPASPTDVVTVARATTGDALGTLLGDVVLGRDGIGGRPFFSGADAADLAVSSAMTGPDTLGAASATAGPLDGSGALRLSMLATAPSGTDDRYRALVVGLGVETRSVGQRVTIQETATASADDARDAQSGVNLDEEMIGLISFQRAYQASARFLTVIDSVLGTLIEQTGLAGR